MCIRDRCITGSTHGIGFGIAEAFAKKGAKIVINSHETDNGALDKLKKLTECYFIQSDLSTINGNKKLIEEANTKLGKIDTLIITHFDHDHIANLPALIQHH